MKKFVFYPILFSINPILLMYFVNINGIPLSLLFPVIFITPLIALGLMWLLNKYYKDIHRAGFIVFIITLWFFYYIPFRIWVNRFQIGSISLSDHWIIFPIWSLIFLLISSRLIWKRVTSPQTITFFLNLVCVILIAFSIIRISMKLVSRFFVRLDVPEVIQTHAKQTENKNFPDIYYIILDGYAREDVLKELYHYNNSGFIQELTNRGFFVASKKSKQLYANTSVTSICTEHAVYHRNSKQNSKSKLFDGYY